MSYSLEFKESALKEWKKLDSTIREQFKKKLAERLVRPRVESARLSSIVVAVGKQENLAVYRSAGERLKN